METPTMTKLKYLTFASGILLLAASAVMSQTQGRPEDACAGAAGCGACGGLGVAMILIPIVIIALNIALLVWVARDAKSRGMDSAVVWMILVMFTSVLGLVIYMFSRPQGNLIQCPHCGNNRLQASAKCPHCGNS